MSSLFLSYSLLPLSFYLFYSHLAIVRQESLFKGFVLMLINLSRTFRKNYRTNIAPSKFDSTSKSLSYEEVGTTELTLYKFSGAYACFNTLQYFVNKFVEWLKKKGEFDHTIYVYSTDDPLEFEYSKTERPELLEKKTGLIYFEQDLNGWLPLYIAEEAWRDVHSPFLVPTLYGHYDDGRNSNHGFILKPGDTLGIIEEPGFYLQLSMDQRQLTVLKFYGVLTENPQLSMKGTGVELERLNEVTIPAFGPVIALFNSLALESHPHLAHLNSKGEGCYSALTAFIPRTSEHYSLLLTHLVELINQIQSFYTVQHGKISPFLVHIVAACCQDDALSFETTSASAKKKRRKKKKKSKLSPSAEDGETPEVDAIVAEEEPFDQEEPHMASVAEEEAACGGGGCGISEAGASEDTHTADESGSAESISSPEIEPQDAPTDDVPAAAERTPEDFMISLVQQLTAIIPQGRMNNKAVMHLLNNWLEICQNQYGLRVNGITQKGSHTTIHTNRGLLTVAAKHGGKDRTFAPSEIRNKARALAELVTGAP